MNPIFLNRACVDVAKSKIAEERQEVNADVIRLLFHIFGISLTKRDDLELAGKRIGGIAEGRTSRRSPAPTIGRRAGTGDKELDRIVQQGSATASALALAILDAPLHLPVAGEVLGGRKIDLFGCLPMIQTAEVSRALPVAAVLTSIDVKRSIHQNMGLNWHIEHPKLCKTCVRVFRSIA